MAQQPRTDVTHATCHNITRHFIQEALTQIQKHPEKGNSQVNPVQTLSDHPPFLGSPGNEIGKNSDPVFSAQRIYPLARVLELLTCPSLPFRVINTQDVQVEVLLNIRSIVRDYHICRFEVNVGEEFTANKKRGERKNAFKVVNQSEQPGHLQSELVDPLWPLHADISVLVNYYYFFFFIKTVTSNPGKQI